MKAILIVDDRSVAIWQLRALQYAQGQLDVALILSCENTRTQVRWIRHALYYVMAVLRRRRLAARQLVKVGTTPLMSFRAESDGLWQRLPSDVESVIRASGAQVVVKFGMSLLRVPNGASDFPPILSFHHGDPRRFRGRPAGFYEVLTGEATAGVIVQSLSNRLDGGVVWAECNTRVIPWSYRRTLDGLLASSECLLSAALRNLERGKGTVLEDLGPLFRLPSNRLVVRFWFLLLRRRVRRLAYGLFCEKRWNIGVLPSFDLRSDYDFQRTSVRAAVVPSEYVFLADPFPSQDESVIRAEALSRRTRVGEIVELDAKTLEYRRSVLRGGHFSYPFSLGVGEREVVIPETAQHLPASMFEESADGWNWSSIRGLEGLRVIDPTCCFHEGKWFLFCGLSGREDSELHVFVSSQFDGPFRAHALNPIVVDPTRARMGGRLLRQGGELMRIGQDCSRGYGNGITVCLVKSLSVDEYDEEVIGAVRCSGAKGPHTLNQLGDGFVVDFYSEHFSPLAWSARVAGRLRGRKRRG